MTAGCSNGSRAAPYGSTAALLGCSNRVSRHSRAGVTRYSSRRKASSTSSAARSRWRRIGCAMASPPGAPATSGGSPNCTRCAASGGGDAARPGESRSPTGTARLDAAQADLSGRLVAAAEGVSKAFGDQIVVRKFSTRIMRGDRVGIVGPNGAGKTTLLKLLTGALAPETGAVRLGTNLAPITIDQRREGLDPKWTLAEAMTGGSGDTVTVGGESRHVIGYMKDFLFRPEQARTPVGVLSGGERARLTLARAFARPCNLLVLDEPTNDLDLETLDLLQEQLAEHPGTVLLVSHDRDFLDRVVTSTIATDGNGRWVEYAGGYAHMLAQRAAESRGSPPPRTRNTKRSRPATQTSGLPGSLSRRMNFTG